MTDYYLHPSGSDTNPGTREKPWRFMHTASRKMASGDALWCCGGQYVVPAARRFTWRPGLHGFRVLPVPGETPVFEPEITGAEDFMSFWGQRGATIEGLSFEHFRQPISVFASDAQPGVRGLTLKDLTIREAGHPGTATQGRGIYIRDNGSAPDTAIDGVLIQRVRISGSSEVGIKVVGRALKVVIDSVVIERCDDGRSVDGDGDGIVSLALANGAPAGLVIRNASIADVSEDGLDLTGTDVVIENVTVRDAGSCGLKLWSPGNHYGAGQGSFTVKRCTVEGAECGIKAIGAPNLGIDDTTASGGEWGLRQRERTNGEAWSSTLATSYSLYSRVFIEPMTRVFFDRCACAAGYPGMETSAVRPVRPLSADFNNDGRVDGLDFIKWQANFGRTDATREQGDANGDGTVDGKDFLAWQSEQGQMDGK